jgi:trimethylamine--corrinoid protein Co-methyltransferase
VRPGAPVLFGTFASSISMQSGAPTFGTPEPSLVSYGAAQLARRLGLPFRTGGSLCASKVPDAQAAYESANTLNSTVLCGTNFVLHSAGWLEGGLASCYEKFMMDIDQLGMQQKFAEGVDLSENGQAMDAIRQVGPGSHYLGCDHTQANFQTAFYRSNIADNNSYEQWQAEGEKTAPQRANELARRWLESYEAPALDPAIDEALTASSARRRSRCPTPSREGSPNQAGLKWPTSFTRKSGDRWQKLAAGHRQVSRPYEAVVAEQRRISEWTNEIAEQCCAEAVIGAR